MVNPDEFEDDFEDEKKLVVQEEEEPEEGTSEEEHPDEDEGDVPEHKQQEESEEDDELKEKRKEERAKRRQAGKIRRKNAELRNKLLIAQQGEMIERLAQELEQLKRTGNTTQLSQIDKEIEEVNTVIGQAERMMAEAIAEADGDKHTRAFRAHEYAKQKRDQLTAAKGNYTPRQAEAPKYDDRLVKSMAERWAGKHSSWFNVDQDATDIAKTVDVQVLKAGFRPDTQAYWNELDRRLSKVMPEHYQTNKSTSTNGAVGTKRPPQLVGGSGRGTAAVAATSNGLKDIPKEYIENLKLAGKWDDEATRKRMIQKYREQVKSTQASA